MMKFTIKSLIALFVTSSALFLTPMKSDAQVNMKTLAEVAKSCQKDMFSKSYYQQMGLDIKTQVISSDSILGLCIEYRYHYSLVLSRFPWLVSTGEILPGYPGSVGIGTLANYNSYDNAQLLDCVISQKASSRECERARMNITHGSKYTSFSYLLNNYLPFVCPSCVLAHDDVSGSQEAILQAFIQWFLKLDKPKRREVISLLGDDDKASQLRQSLRTESREAVQKYWEARKRVEQQEQERRRRELLGN
ncbi:MAG: hypothetical protein EAZ87_16240 [Nostocales cyanobacterium]|nr:MAG: hypothetical protein EAZ87_16240 [Nostocales cyanobacterium]